MPSDDTVITHALRRMGVGALARRYYHQPRNYLQWLRARGWPAAWHAVRGEAAMRRAVLALPPCPMPASDALAVSFMTGRRFWHQTALCAHTLARHTPGGVRPTFFDDGSLSETHAATLRRLFPGANVVGHDAVATTVASGLPPAQFPLLHDTARRVPLFRKFFHLRGATPGWQLCLDSDMLFFGRPEFLETHARSRRPCFMHDPVYGYCVGPDDLALIVGRPVPAHANTGILGLDNDAIDWRAIEALLARFPENARRHRLFEQTLSAIVLSTLDAATAPPERYTVVESPWFERPADVVLLHYIRNAKWRYTSDEWRTALATDPR